MLFLIFLGISGDQYFFVLRFWIWFMVRMLKMVVVSIEFENLHFSEFFSFILHFHTGPLVYDLDVYSIVYF